MPLYSSESMTTEVTPMLYLVLHDICCCQWMLEVLLSGRSFCAALPS